MLKLQYFGHLIGRVNPLGENNKNNNNNNLMLGKY